MIHCPLHKLEVAAITQKLGAEIVPVIVESEVCHASLDPHSLPPGFSAGKSQSITLPAYNAELPVAVHGNIGEDELRMLPLKREEYFSNAVRYREHHTLVALP